MILVFWKMICTFNWSIIFDWHKHAKKELNMYLFNKLVVIWFHKRDCRSSNSAAGRISHLAESVKLVQFICTIYATGSTTPPALTVMWNLLKCRAKTATMFLCFVCVDVKNLFTSPILFSYQVFTFFGTWPLEIWFLAWEPEAMFGHFWLQ